MIVMQMLFNAISEHFQTFWVVNQRDNLFTNALNQQNKGGIKNVRNGQNG